MHCPKCGKEFIDEEKICSNCGFDSTDIDLGYQKMYIKGTTSDIKISQNNLKKNHIAMKKISYTCFTIVAVLIVVGCVFFNKGFDKKNNYLNSTTYTDLNQNAYVGGDAYNYIINSEYFIGYIIIGSAAFICGAIFTTLGVYLYLKDESITNRKQIAEQPVENIKQKNNIEENKEGSI